MSIILKYLPHLRKASIYNQKRILTILSLNVINERGRYGHQRNAKSKQNKRQEVARSTPKISFA